MAQPGTADSLYQDPTAAYAPVLENIKAQETAANQRYAENKADITNIFGSVSTIGAADAARIQDQFKATIVDQQMNLAKRTAEARTGVAENVKAVKTVGAERGVGPAMLVNPVETEANAGIARSNEYQTVWENLLKANSLQAQQDTANRTAGYKLEEQSALKALQKQLQDQLLTLGGQKSSVMSDIAQAKLQAKQTVLNTKYQEAQDLLARQRSAAAAASKPKTYASSAVGWEQQVGDTYGSAVPGGIRSFVTGQINALSKTRGSDGKLIKPTQSSIIARLNSSSKFANDPALPAAIEYVQKYSGLPK